MSDDPVKDLFLRALEIDRVQRDAFLRGQTNDAALLADVQSLLAAHDTSETFLESGALRDAGLAPAFDSSWAVPGASLGPFIIESVIGSGGMGVVFRARQQSPPRPVALKIMRAPALPGGMLKRFTREAAVLARLQHPSIAQIYSAGVEHRPGGPGPYLAMELVEGTPLDHHIRQHDLSARDRTELMAKIAEAVAHAHQRGVVHRDLKPPNILVQSDGIPKVLDFGIARLIDLQGQDSAVPTQTLQTQRGEILGTLAYMSPEQFEGDSERIDVRSDVYSLGAILYEVMAGRPAIPTDRLSIAQAATAVATREPTPLGSLSPHLRGDLETIAAKALDKDPQRRYQSAAELAEDLRRHLRDEPILARPATTFYRASKFVRRHRTVVILGLGVILALTAGLFATLWQAREAERQRDLASSEVTSTNEINDFLGQILLASDPERARGKTVTIRMALDEAAARLAKGEIKSPRVLASLHGTISKSYWSLGDMPTAEMHIRKAIELCTQIHGPFAPETMFAIADLGTVLHDSNRKPECRQLTEPALAESRIRLGDDHPATLRLLTVYANSLDDIALTEPLYLEALERNTRIHGPDSDQTLSALNNLGILYVSAGRSEEGIKIHKNLYEKRRRLLGDDHPDTIISCRNVATALMRGGQLKESLDYTTLAVQNGERVRGKSHPGQLQLRFEYALQLAMLGRHDDAAASLRQSIPLTRSPEGEPTSATVMHNGLLAEVLILQNKLGEAEAIAVEAHETSIKLSGPRHHDTLLTIGTLLSVCEARQNWIKAREWNDQLKGTSLYQEKYTLAPGQDPASPPTPPPSAPTPPPDPAPASDASSQDKSPDHR
ncbi:MAG: serine/threonine protein kinase [Phycisphaerales bacterium]|nr:serine/threonine protein kinase [Phycisphaerales bacterium]